jgi:hypothetical protein
MMTDSIRKRIGAYKEAVAGTGTTHTIRYPMDTPSAIALLDEITDVQLKHPELVKAAAKALAEVGPPPEDHEGILKHYQELGELTKTFWEGFEQQEVDGVEIIRRR